MAHAAAAGDENHRRGTDLCHEQRVVVSTTDHPLHLQIELAANLDNRSYQPGIANCWSVHVHALHLKLNAATAADLRHCLLDSVKSVIPRGELGIAQINFQPGATRHAVDRAG